MAIIIKIDRQSGTLFGDDEAKRRSYTFNELQDMASNGDADAQCAVADYFSSDDVTAPDVAKAMFWYKKAADQGIAKAQFLLGQAYCVGIGVEKNLDQAEVMLKNAAEKNYPEAESMLAMVSIMRMTGG